jgi:hypothetical protein
MAAPIGPPSGFIGNPGQKGRPNIPSYFGGGGGGGAYGGGKGGYQLGGPLAPRRKRIDDVAEAAPQPPSGSAYLPPAHTPLNRPNFYINPYRGIPGFEDYQHDILRIRGDQVGKVGAQHYPEARGFPDRARVTQISEAMQRLGALPPPRPHAMGTGVAQAGPDEIIKKLLRERLYGSATKGVI